MSTLSKLEPPKRPQTAYFKFRAQKLAQYKDQSNRIQLVKSEWQNLDPNLKDKMDQDYNIEMNYWKEQISVWEQKYGKIEKKRDKYIEQSDESRPEKQKGASRKTEGRGEEKAKKQKIQVPKCKNKMFADIQFQESFHDLPQQRYQDLQLQVQKREKKQSAISLQNFDQKACNFKKKLQFKQLNKDHKYKKHMQQKLKSLQQVQEVNILVEVPKLFGGKKSHLQAALFLKNNREDSLQQVQALDQKIQKRCFKQSILDDQDYLSDLQNNTKNKQSQLQQSQLSKPNSHVSKQYTHNTQDLYENQQKLANTQVIHKKKRDQKKPKQKINKKKFMYLNLLQVQAEISDDQEERGTRISNDSTSNEESQSQIDSMIDDDVNIDSNDQCIVHQKFISDMIEQEEKKYNQIRQKLQRKYLEEQQELKKRMKEAARKNIEKQLKQQQVHKVISQQQILLSNSQSNSTVRKEKNKEKLKELQQLLRGETKQARQKKLLQNASQSGKLQELETTIFCRGNINFRQPSRNGLQSIDIQKSSKIVTRKK